MTQDLRRGGAGWRVIIQRERERWCTENRYILEVWKAELLRKQGWCHWCSRPIGKEEATLEHLIPLFYGGVYMLENLALSCKRCNLRRGSGLTEETLNSLPAVVLRKSLEQLQKWSREMEKEACWFEKEMGRLNERWTMQERLWKRLVELLNLEQSRVDSGLAAYRKIEREIAEHEAQLRKARGIRAFRKAAPDVPAKPTTFVIRKRNKEQTS